MSRNFPNLDWMEWWHFIILVVIVFIWNLLYSRLGWNTFLFDNQTFRVINEADCEIRKNPSTALEKIQELREDSNYKWSIVNNEDKKNFQFLTDEILERIVNSFAEKKQFNNAEDTLKMIINEELREVAHTSYLKIKGEDLC